MTTKPTKHQRTCPVATDDQGEVRALHSASLEGAAVPDRVLLAPWGTVDSTSGTFVVDEESARLVVAAFEEHGTDLPIDYEHQTLGGDYASPNGQAPAAGWIKRIVAEPGVGLLVQIEWTDQATRMLSAKEYRYLSPVAVIRKSDRKLVRIHSAALTNKPAIVGMEPIANCAADTLEISGDEPFALLKNELELPADSPAETVLVAAGRRLADLRNEASQRAARERVVAAMRAGKLVEAQREWAEALVAREADLFDEWFRTAPVVVRPGCTTPPSGLRAVACGSGGTAARARSEYRSNHLLAAITTEDAYVADAVRQARVA